MTWRFRTLTFLFLLTTIQLLPGFPIDKYLATARKDALIEARQAGQEYLFTTRSGLPFIRDAEFKVRNEGFALSRQRYTLQLSPKGLGEGRASRLYMEAQFGQREQRNKVLLNRALLNRYLLVIELLMRKSSAKLYEQIIVVSEDRIKVLNKQMAGEKFDLNALIEAEIDLTKLQALALDSKKEIHVLEQRIGLACAPDTFSGFDTTGLVGMESIIAEVEKTPFVVDSNHVYLEYLDQGLALAEKRFRLEQSLERQLFKSLSFSYDMGKRLDEVDRRTDGKDYDLAHAYILEASMRIPGLNSNQSELNRRKSDFLSEKEDVVQNQRQLRESMQKDIEDIHSLISQYRYLMARENEVDAQSSLKKYMQMTGVDPIILLSIKTGSLKNSLKIEEVKYGIMMNYIKVMDATGRLSQTPLRNFLSENGTELRP